MPETVQQYVTRINSYIGTTDPLSVLAETPSRLRSLLSLVPESRLRARPASDRWSLLEVAVHLSDVEIVIGWRIRSILGAPDGIPIQAYDQNSWQESLGYNERELAPTLDAFTAARENNVRLYRSLSESQWNKFGLHSERGQESVRDTIRLQAGHDLNHLRQIEGILGNSVAAQP
ncbi:MAG: DinB family protein [Terriglobales bacterium]